tara:strand:- start:2634 stop:3089 length:456 start_codon:yes stop_codon:yes gene_type:complete
MKLHDAFMSSNAYYELFSNTYEYKWSPDKTLRITVNENDADLNISYHDHADGDIQYLDETDADFWIGAVLYWYDAMELSGFHKIQIDAIARLAKWLKFVPHEELIKKYAVPNKAEVLTYDEQINALAKDEYDFAVRLKSHRDSFKNAEGAD